MGPQSTAAMIEWRHDLHRNPEFGFEEKRTSAFVAARLRDFGLDEVVEGVGGTGVVGTLRRGSSGRTITLRADMDALRINEQNSFDYRSVNPGVMHACGHDGHTSMLLGAAQWLASEGGFDGTVRFLFQPAEEWGRGALAMISDGLFERFPTDEIYGVHNFPGLPVGHFATATGPVMAAEDLFEITLQGVGGHASRPHSGREALVAASALVLNLQTIVSRRINPAHIAVVSVTEFITDGTRNALPSVAVLRGDVRTFQPSISDTVFSEMRRIAEGTAQAYGSTCSLSYTHEFIPLVNEAVTTAHTLAAASTVFSHIDGAFEPFTASEDFAQFLRLVPGSFAFLGNGADSWPLHHPSYDFNDEGLFYGARYFVELVQHRLG